VILMSVFKAEDARLRSLLRARGFDRLRTAGSGGERRRLIRL
jgi:hypothetical protein